MKTLEKIVAELERQYDENHRGLGLGWLAFDDDKCHAVIDGRVDLDALAMAVDA